MIIILCFYKKPTDHFYDLQRHVLFEILYGEAIKARSPTKTVNDILRRAINSAHVADQPFRPSGDIFTRTASNNFATNNFADAVMPIREDGEDTTRMDKGLRKQQIICRIKNNQKKYSFFELILPRVCDDNNPAFPLDVLWIFCEEEDADASRRDRWIDTGCRHVARVRIEFYKPRSNKPDKDKTVKK
ncbi:hypothetical protein GEV33_006368 [Tenebrio molitor]|uniref:Uncharacterized protein n=1 Tax=Tenebrio molitor TaxID=7067 RepID=A0A8J6HMS3_TENMO|nr:hypothetical protein GEV33_006368 [Tenebrio molitor]